MKIILIKNNKIIRLRFWDHTLKTSLDLGGGGVVVLRRFRMGEDRGQVPYNAI